MSMFASRYVIGEITREAWFDASDRLDGRVQHAPSGQVRGNRGFIDTGITPEHLWRDKGQWFRLGLSWEGDNPNPVVALDPEAVRSLHMALGQWLTEIEETT